MSLVSQGYYHAQCKYPPSRMQDDINVGNKEDAIMIQRESV